jgi:hypothetical protein
LKYYPKHQSLYYVKKILNLEGAVELTRVQQQSIRGGIACSAEWPCKKGSYCHYFPELESSAPEGICVLNPGQ